MLLPATNNFIRGLFVGRSLAEVDGEVLECVRNTYLASSQKAIQMAYLEAVKKYRTWICTHRDAAGKKSELDTEGK